MAFKIPKKRFFVKIELFGEVVLFSHIYVKIQRKISSIYGIDFIFNLIFLLFITQKAVKAQIIVKISEKMLPSSEKIIS